ncbi:PTS glucose transporter subunit IIBC [Clostridiales bacterium COT073_COT-073]|nr:PTS glucose transporter subunit IIBC [Clostridiales bacterium COT073_COT-073]
MKKHLQRLGRSLMQPVAVLPVAALLLGIGYMIDPVNWGGSSPVAAFFIKSGDAVLANLGMIFAVGIAYGMSKDKNGAAALSGLVGFLVITTLLSEGSVTQLRHIVGEDGKTLVAPLATEGFGKINNAFIGIISGIIASLAYNRFYQVKLPDFLSFFSGRRLTPIITSFYAIAASVVLFFTWPLIYSGLVGFGTGILSLGSIGAGIYAFFNRLLIPTGLHHALNAVFWFDIASIKDITLFLEGPKTIKLFAEGPAAIEAAGLAVRDIKTVGMYQAGFFPIMMFGLPGAALAMYHTAKDNKKKITASLLMAGALASFVTGVTEPLEFAFMFLAPMLYLIHALLTGISVALVSMLGFRAGFGFSAGLFDMILSARNPLANQWYMLLVVGLVFFAIYYFVFKFFILKFNLKTPGREDDDEANPNEGVVLGKDTNFAEMAKIILEGLGGKDNIAELDHCITRLRIDIKQYELVDEKQIKKTKIAGIIRPSQKHIQVIVGPQVQFVFDELKKLV